MNIGLLEIIISACTSIIIVILSQYLIRNQEKKRFKQSETNKICREYINPLRFMLSENYYRISEIVSEVKKHGKNEILLVIDKPEELMDNPMEWFVGKGCYLVSSCYLTACLFVYLEKIREDMPFLSLTENKDTDLLLLVNKIAVDFSINLNIFYVLQMNIGKELYNEKEHRILTYREFCELLKDNSNFNWYSSLINYYLRVGNGQLNEADYLLNHIKQLSGFLDVVALGGNSIEQKIKAENEAKVLR